MKKTIVLTLLMLLAARAADAGGIMTNTNYHIAFDRMMARGATRDIDAIFSNPAGLAWGHEGWQLSFNWQMPAQHRDITSTFPLYPEATHVRKYKGRASAPFVPGLFVAYKSGRWSVGGMLGIVGSGGYVRYDDGVPMFTAPTMALLYAQSGGQLTPEAYSIDSQLKGKQYIYGAQLNFTYKIAKNFAAAVGLRANYYDGYYRGHLTATLRQAPVTLIDLHIDSDQAKWGFTPIVSVDYHAHNFTFAAKYELRTKLNVPNDTHVLSATVTNPSTMQPLDQATTQALLADKLAPYQDRATTRYDMPSLLSIAAGYDFTPALRATIEYHFFDDKHAHMSGDRQKQLTHGTHEWLAGVEWDLSPVVTLSTGAQRTDYGLSDGYQTNTSFACDSYSIGLGGAVNLSRRLRLNLSYFWTMYDDYTKASADYLGTSLQGADTYSRTNGVLGIGFDYKF